MHFVILSFNDIPKRDLSVGISREVKSFNIHNSTNEVTVKWKSKYFLLAFIFLVVMSFEGIIILLALNEYIACTAETFIQSCVYLDMN